MKRKNGTMSAMFLIGLLVAAPAMAGPLEVFVGWLDLVCKPCSEVLTKTASTEDDTFDPYPEPPANTTESQSSSLADDQLQKSDPQE